MDTTTSSVPAEKHILIKLLAIVGFFATAAFVLWLAVQGVRLFPAAFSSLASLAEGVRSYRSLPELTIGLEKNIVNSGESFMISWTDLKREGTYSFTYTCHDGVVLSVRTDRGDIRDILCTETLSLPHTTQSLTLGVKTEAQRFTEIPFVVSFTESRGTEVLSTAGSVTVVNARIPLNDSHTGPDDVTDTETDSGAEDGEASEEDDVTTPTVPSTPSRPVSNPNGTPDLKITLLGIGTMTDTDVFTKTTAFDDAKRAGVSFQVENIGTKISNQWVFSTKLGDETDYTSGLESPLMPGDRVIYTIGFALPLNEDELELTTLLLDVADKNILNNLFTVTAPIN
jgi:hypothetical protein